MVSHDSIHQSGQLGGLDFEQMFASVEEANSIEYRHPFPPNEKITRAQDHAWRFLMAREDQGPKIAMIGAKGSGKTHFGSAYAFHMAQKYHESLGCVISNTYTQAKDNAGALLMKMARNLGFNTRFFQTKTVKGRPYTSLFVIDLDGLGWDEGKCSYVLVRSFEAVNKLEGIELDWLWCEEIQDAREEDFVTVYTRVRGQHADNATFIAGMPVDESHWIYSRIPRLGAVEEAEVRRKLGVGQFDVREFEEAEQVWPEKTINLHEADVRGIFLEPSIFENKHNLPSNYIEDMFGTLDKELAERWIFGRRTSLSGNRVAYNYDTPVHQRGRMSQVLCHYDPSLQIVVSVDFNVSPLCASVWQVKPWSDAWDAPNILYNVEEDLVFRKYGVENGDGEIGSFRTERIDGGFYEIALPDRDVLAQIDEFEIWEGGTRGFVEKFIDRYGPNGMNHQGGIRVLGDSTGDRRQTSSQTTDWQIIQNALRDLPNTAVTPGVKVSSDYKSGKVKYINPERRDTFNVLNVALKDFNGHVHVCFLPHSNLESGGAPASTQAAKYRGDGIVDDSNDKKDPDKKHVRRTHFFDTVRYVVWDFRGGIVTPPSWSAGDSGLPNETVVSREEFGAGRYGNDWGGLF